MSLSYDQTFASQYIGTTLTVDAVAIEPIQQISVTPLTYSAGTVTLSGAFGTAGISASTPLFVSDGIRTWEFTSASGSTITLSHAALLSTLGPGDTGYIPLSWKVSSSQNLFNEEYQAYVGTLITGATSGAQFTVQVGQFAEMTLNDSGSNGDHSSDDGIWTGTFTVPNNGTVVTNANFYGYVEVGGTGASNDDFQSQQSVSFDMELPALVTVQDSTTIPNYNGDLYLSSKCQGLSATNPANVQPSSAQAQFNFTVNKPNTVVNITISPAAPWTMPGGDASLPTYVFPNNSTSLNGWTTWIGDDGSQNFVNDGVYNVSYYINDTNGLVGQTVTTQIKVVSLKVLISDITLTPPIIGTEPSQTGVITNIHYNVDVINDSGGVLNSSLKVLGWYTAGNAGVGGVNQNVDPESTVWTMENLSTLNASGVSSPLPWSTVDTYDDDAIISNYFTSPANPTASTYPYFYDTGPSGTDGSPPGPPTPYWTAQIGDVQLYGPPTSEPSNGLIIDVSGNTAACNLPITVRTDLGDQNLDNDWRIKGMQQMVATGGTSLDPTDLSDYDRNGGEGVTYEWTGSTPAQGNYVIDISSQLTGLGWTGPPEPLVSTANTSSPCNPAAGAVFDGDIFHYWPQSEPELLGFPTQGDLITFQNTSAIFVVNNSSNPTSDNAPPEYASSNPALNSVDQPNVYSASNPLQVQFEDTNTAFNTAGAYSYATLTGPNGIVISGSSSTNGGGVNSQGNFLTVYFSPSSPLLLGGNYTLTAYTCNTAGLCVQEAVPFTIQDTAAPELQSGGVILYDQSGNQYPFNLCQGGTAGPYQDISELSVSIQMPPTSTNFIYLPGCSVSLYQVSGTAQIPVGMTLLSANASPAGAPTQATLTYQISPVLNSAGLYEVAPFTESENASGTIFTGPASLGASCTNDPEFTMEGCTACVSLFYANDQLGISGATPITITSVSSGVTMTTASVLPVLPPAATLPPASGYAFLDGLSGSTSDSALGFEVNTSGSALATALQWTYPNATPVDFYLYYNQSDLTTAGSTASSLVLLGYSHGAWNQVTGVTMPTTPTALNNVCSFQAPNGLAACVYYALAYPSDVTSVPTATPPAGATGTPTATPISLLSTRAFDPWNSNPLYQRARFYYSATAPATMEARIYDTSGGLIRDLTLGNGISASQSSPTDSSGDVEYYFTWDGTNSSGTVVHNGIYLVRWTETGIDGSHNTQTRPVALIK
jgi:hypothetical protein